MSELVEFDAPTRLDRMPPIADPIVRSALASLSLRDFREESLSNKLATGNKNPVGILAILNRHFAWNLPGVSRENTNKTALTAAEIRQQLNQNDTQLMHKQQINAINNSDTI